MRLIVYREFSARRFMGTFDLRLRRGLQHRKQGLTESDTELQRTMIACACTSCVCVVTRTHMYPPFFFFFSYIMLSYIMLQLSRMVAQSKVLCTEGLYMSLNSVTSRVYMKVRVYPYMQSCMFPYTVVLLRCSHTTVFGNTSVILRRAKRANAFVPC